MKAETTKICPKCGQPFTGRALKIQFNETEYHTCSFVCANAMQRTFDAQIKEQQDRQREEAQNG